MHWYRLVSSFHSNFIQLKLSHKSNQKLLLIFAYTHDDEEEITKTTVRARVTSKICISLPSLHMQRAKEAFLSISQGKFY